MEETNVDSRKVGGCACASTNTSTSIEAIERSKEPSPKALKDFEAKKKQIYDGFISEINHTAQQLFKKTISIEELNRTWKKDPRYTTEINKFISGHPELKDYELSGGILKFKPPVSTSSGVTIIIANKNDLPDEVTRDLGLYGEQKSTMIGILTTFDITQKRNNVYQKIKVNGEWEIDTNARRKSLLKTEAERIIQEWKVAEQKQMDEQIARERFELEKNVMEQTKAQAQILKPVVGGISRPSGRSNPFGDQRPDYHNNPMDQIYYQGQTQVQVQTQVQTQFQIPKPQEKFIAGRAGRAEGVRESSSSRSNLFGDQRSDYHK